MTKGEQIATALLALLIVAGIIVVLMPIFYGLPK